MSGETREDESGWTTDTLLALFERRLDDLRASLQERYETQTKAIDAAFVAQQTAMRTAFDAADRAVQAALQAAEKAVVKAETASEKRFDSVNEFRATLSDQAATLMPRVEAEGRLTALAERTDEASTRNTEAVRLMELRVQAVPTAAERDAIQRGVAARESALMERINSLEVLRGQESGRTAGVGQSVALMVSVGAIVLTIIIAVLTIILSR
jgi:hypothetical protein